MEPGRDWKKMSTLEKMLWGTSATVEEYHERLIGCLEVQRMDALKKYQKSKQLDRAVE